MSWKTIIIVIALIVFAFLFNTVLRNKVDKRAFIARGVVLQNTIIKLDSLNDKSTANQMRIDTLILIINKIEKVNKP